MKAIDFLHEAVINVRRTLIDNRMTSRDDLPRRSAALDPRKKQCLLSKRRPYSATRTTVDKDINLETPFFLSRPFRDAFLFPPMMEKRRLASIFGSN